MNRHPDRVIEHFATVSVTVLPPGWQNVYRNDDGGVLTTPCPALLLQEHRYTERVWDAPGEDSPYGIRTKREDHAAPFETRVVFADFELDTELSAACYIANYVTTTAPGEDPTRYAEETS